MRLTICAVGRLRKGPEKDLTDDYLARATRAGRAIGLGPVAVNEVDDRKGGGMAGEADLLRKAVPDGFVRVVLDERGERLTSPQFANQIAKWRDTGRPGVAFMIGGADGLDPALRAEADFAVSFGAMVWPHMLVRVMLSEQLYRGISILMGNPYHRA